MLKKYRLLRQSGLAVFDRRTVANILGVSYASSNPILYRLVRGGVLVHLRRDCYVLPEDIPGRSRKIANDLVKPSALSLWTVLSDAGVTTQVPRVVQSVTPKPAVVIEEDSNLAFQYAHLPASLFFDVHPDAEGILRVSPEKALLDLLFIQQGAIDWAGIDVSALNRKKLLSFVAAYPRIVQMSLHARRFLSKGRPRKTVS